MPANRAHTNRPVRASLRRRGIKASSRSVMCRSARVKPRALTIFTIDEVRRLLSVWRDTGEAGNGSYFWAVDQLIVPEPGLRAMVAAIRTIVDTGEIAYVGVRAENQSV